LSLELELRKVGRLMRTEKPSIFDAYRLQTFS